MGTVTTLMPLWVTARGGLEWLLYDKFTTPDSAPITSPRTCEPGPGTLTAVETDGTLAISSEELVFTAQSTPSWGDLGFHCTGQTRDSGLGLYVKANLTTWEECGIGWHGAAAVVDPDNAEHAIQANTTNGRFDDENATPIITGLSASTDYNLLQILRSVGCHYVLDGELLWVDDAGATATLYPMFAGLDGAGLLDNLGVVDLPANGYPAWDADFSTVTDTKMNPANGTAFDCDADFHLNFTFTYETGKTVTENFRKLDTNNQIYVQATATDLKLRKTVLGADSGVAEAAAVFSDATPYEVDVVGWGSSIKVFLDKVLKIDSTVTDLVTETGGFNNTDLATNDIVLTTHPNPALGIATDRVIAPQATNAYTHTDDVLCVINNVTLPTANSLDFQFRISGSDEVTFQLASDGSLLLLDNAETEISAGGGTVSNGDDVVVVLEGADGEVFVAGTSAGTTSTIAIVGGTAGKRSDSTDGICDYAALFPRDVSGILPGALV